MARVELIMPKMGESVSEATIITWNKNVGDNVELDETIIEIATDKVDSEVPSTHEGKLVEMLFSVDDVVKVGEAFAILETDGEDSDGNDKEIEQKIEQIENVSKVSLNEKPVEKNDTETKQKQTIVNSSDRFYSPLVKSIELKKKSVMLN